jgi:hypothetical protein
MLDAFPVSVDVDIDLLAATIDALNETRCCPRALTASSPWSTREGGP